MTLQLNTTKHRSQASRKLRVERIPKFCEELLKYFILDTRNLPSESSNATSTAAITTADDDENETPRLKLQKSLVPDEAK